MTVRRGDPCTLGDGKPIVGRGWCSKHYATWQKYGDPLHETRRYVRQGESCEIEGCDAKPTRRGMCAMHVRREIKHGDTTDPRERRFWAQVDKSGPVPESRPDLGPCWVWSGYVHPKTGYGQFGVRNGTRLAHRIAYQYLVGPIPKGLHLDHVCRNRACVNAANGHLEPVTPFENLRRGDQGAFWGYVPEPVAPKQKAPKPTVCTEAGCERPAAKRGLCRPHYRLRLKDPARPSALTVEQRFWAKVDKHGPVPGHKPELGPCWVWTASINAKTGYGRFGISHGHMTDAHRYAYFLAHGPVPDGLDVHHECHTRRCVRFEHLRAMTRAANMAQRKNRRDTEAA
jgi:hypothetical protein